jgi:hypothetical protein
MMNRTTAYKYTIGATQKGALTISLILGGLVSEFSEAGPITSFDAPGAGTGAGQGTFAVNINAFGNAIGWFVDANTVYHGFVRYPNGRVATIDAPGAGAIPGSGQGTAAYSINIEGTIAGLYQDTNNVIHGFLRDPDGHIITLDAPGAGTGMGQGTFAVDINLEGTIAGYTQDNNKVYHGFLRSRWGAFTSFDAPNAGTAQFEGTVVTLESGLNPLGVTIGWYYDANGAAHGYVRARSGAITSFDPPGAANTFPGSVNPEGVIVGGAADANGVLHGFVRSAEGAITSFDVPGAGSTPGLFEGTLALGITPFGLSTGYWADAKRVYHGFLRYPNGAIFKFDAPGAGTVPGSLQGTVPQGRSFWGEIVGYLQDSNYVYHGFIRIP